MTQHPWTDEETQKAYELKQNGKSYAHIGKLLGRTRKAVEHKLQNPEIKMELKHSVQLDPKEFGYIPLRQIDGGGWIRFGLVSDTHLACKECRLDALHAQYDLFKREGITTVLHAGNIVDGYLPRINGDSALETTIDGQVQHVIDNYPQRTNIVTHYITGDDHESWFKEGFNFGAYLQYVANDQGRSDLKYIGHIEADCEIQTKGAKRSTIIKVQHPGGGSAYSRSYTGQKQVECVPLNSEILTRFGWTTYDLLTIGEEVLGHNYATGKNEWTLLQKINVGRGDLYRYSNDQFSVDCTENHRWIQEVEQRAGPNKNSLIPKPYSRRYIETAPLGHTKRRARIIQSAQSPSGPGLGDFTYQDFLRREDSSNRVLQMTSGERRAFIEGLLIAEGCRAVVKGREHQQIVFSQNRGPVLDAFRLACALEGISTNERPLPGGSYKPGATQHCAVTVSTKQTQIVNRLKKETLGENIVWCPTTGLGTWVMRQGRTITITGNSFQGGEKPAILVQGHYHVSNYMIERNVHVISMPGFKDQDVFSRKKRLRSEVGGALLSFKVNPYDGAITRCSVEFNMFFDRGYYKPFLKSDSRLLKGHLVIKQ